MRLKSVKITFIILCGILSAWLPSSYAGKVDPTVMNAIAKGGREWANNCARCHNYRESAEFSAEQWRVIMMHMRIQCGLTGEDERNIYAFLSAQNANKQESADNSQDVNQAVTSSTVPGKQKGLPLNSGQTGKAIFHQTCAACHGVNGKGALPGAPDFTSKTGPLSKGDAILLKHIENGYQAPGSPMAMPPKGGNPNLTTDDLKKVLVYIRSTYGSK